MNKIIVSFGLCFAASGFLACASQNTTQISQTTNVNAPAQNLNDSEVVSSHSAEKPTSANNLPQNVSPVAKSETKTKWTQSGEPVDVSSFNAQISKDERDLKDKPKDKTKQKVLAESYLKRAIALTDARQYASALGDYRRVLKLDSSNEDAKKWIDQIIGIYQSMNREAPPEGEEPPPLPFKKTEM